MDKEQFVAELSKLRPAATFLVLHKYCNEHGEVADFNIIFHMSYEHALERSIAIVEKFDAKGNELAERAAAELLASYKESLRKVQTQNLAEVEDGYSRFFDEANKEIKGVKLHEASNTLHLFGLIHLKRIITPGIYKVVNHRPLTIEKRKIQKLLPVARFRQFRVRPEQLEKIRVENISLLPPESNNED